MNVSKTLRRILTTTTVATALAAGCDSETGRVKSDLDRADDAQTPAQQILDYGLGIIDGVTGGYIEGFLGDYIDNLLGGGDDFVTLSQESLDAIRDIVTEALDDEAWEQEGLDLEAEVNFIGGYARSICETSDCDQNDEYQQDEENVEGHSEELHRFWVFFEDQGGIGQKMSGVPQMMLIGSLRIMLLQEIVELRNARGLNTDQVVQNLKEAACDYHDALETRGDEFETWQAGYTEVGEGDVTSKCGGAWGYNQCQYTWKVCFNSPRGQYCDETSRVEGSYIPPEFNEWGNPDLVEDVKAAREEWMLEDFNTILGGDGFDTLLSKLMNICSSPPQPASVSEPEPEPEPEQPGSEPAGSSCAGLCGGQNFESSCFCDDQCVQYGDCCDDYAQVCE